MSGRGSDDPRALRTVPYATVTGSDSCSYPAFEGTDYDADAGRLTVRVGTDRRGAGCDAAVTTWVDQLWLALDGATVPRRRRLQQSDYDQVRTSD